MDGVYLSLFQNINLMLDPLFFIFIAGECIVHIISENNTCLLSLFDRVDMILTYHIQHS